MNHPTNLTKENRWDLRVDCIFPTLWFICIAAKKGTNSEGTEEAGRQSYYFDTNGIVQSLKGRLLTRPNFVDANGQLSRQLGFES